MTETTSADGSLEAVKEIRSIAGEQCFVSGMSSVVEDIKDLTMQEAPMYVVIAVILTSIILALTMDSFLIPLFFMLSVGMAIIYNMGTNFIQGEISFITRNSGGRASACGNDRLLDLLVAQLQRGERKAPW